VTLGSRPSGRFVIANGSGRVHRHFLAIFNAFSLLLVGGLFFVPSAWAEPEVTADDLLPTVLDLIRSGDPDLLPIAMEEIRTGLPGVEVTRRLAQELLPDLGATLQIPLLAALADRGDPAALPGIAALVARSADPTVRAAAIRGLAAVGGPDEVPLLVGFLSDPMICDAARDALVTIRSEGISSRLVAMLQDAAQPLDTRVAVIEILTTRRDRAPLPALVAAVVDSAPEIRMAAMQSLGELGGGDEIPGMVRGVLAAASGSERAAAERAVVLACTKGLDKDRAEQVLLASYKGGTAAEQVELLPLVAAVGGPEPLTLVDARLASHDDADRRLGILAVCRWPNAIVADRLLTLIEAAGDESDRDRLIAALIRIAPLPGDILDDAERLALVRQVMDLCRTDEQRRRLLERASAIRTVETLRFVLPSLDNPALVESACRSVVELAHHRTLRDAHKDEFMAALDRVMATTKNEELVTRATHYQAGQTWKR